MYTIIARLGLRLNRWKYIFFIKYLLVSTEAYNLVYML